MTVGVTESFFGFETGLRARSGDTVCLCLFFAFFVVAFANFFGRGKQLLLFMTAGRDSFWDISTLAPMRCCACSMFYCHDLAVGMS